MKKFKASNIGISTIRVNCILKLFYSAPIQKVDIGIIMGADGIDAEQVFSAQKQAVMEILSSYTISFEGARVGVILNSYVPTSPIKLGEYNTRDSFARSFMSLVNPTSEKNLNAAFMLARTSLFSQGNGARADAPKVLIAFVSHALKDADVSALGYEARSLHSTGVKIIAIGLGDEVNPDDLEEVFDTWFFPEDLPSMSRLIYPITAASLPGI